MFGHMPVRGYGRVCIRECVSVACLFCVVCCLSAVCTHAKPIQTYVYVCMYLCIYECMYACMYIYAYVHMHAYIYVHMNEHILGVCLYTILVQLDVCACM